MIYELRHYISAPDRVGRLNKRFAEEAIPRFKKHGLDLVAFFERPDKPHHLIYILRFPDEQARQAAWAAFRADPEWQAVKASSDADGVLVSDNSSTLLTLTAFSPSL